MSLTLTSKAWAEGYSSVCVPLLYFSKMAGSYMYAIYAGSEGFTLCALLIAPAIRTYRRQNILLSYL